MSAAQINGRIDVKRRPHQPAATVIVYAEPLDEPVPVYGGRYRLEQADKTFRPHVLAIPVGSTVTFPNEDPFFHNVFSMSYPGPFDLGLYRSRQSRHHLFTHPAVYHVFCNIHPQMAAVILVLPTNYITQARKDGTYALTVPEGNYRVTAWSEASKPASIEVTVNDGANDDVVAPALVLDETDYVLVPHKNKYGQDYPRATYDAANPDKQ